MLNFLTQIPELVLSGAIPPIVIKSDTTVLLSMSCGAVSVLEDEYYPDSDNNITVLDIDRIILPYFKSPAIQAVLYQCPDLSKEFTIVINNGVDAEQTMTFTAVRGAIDFDGDDALFFNQNFLSLLPNRKKTVPSAQEYINFYAPAGTFLIQANCTYVNGQTATITLHSQTDGAVGVYVYPVSLAAANIDIYGVVEYSISVVFPTNTITFNYELDLNYYERAHHFRFINRFGVPETLFCSGKRITAMNYDEKQMVLTIAGRRNIGNAYELTTCNTGLAPSVAQAYWVHEFFDSELKEAFHPDFGWRDIALNEQGLEYDAIDAITRNFAFSYYYAVDRLNPNLTRKAKATAYITDNEGNYITDNTGNRITNN